MLITADVVASGEQHVCSSCGGEDFIQPFKIIFISKLNPKNTDGEDLYANIPQPYICVACGKNLPPISKKNFDVIAGKNKVAVN